MRPIVIQWMWHPLNPRRSFAASEPVASGELPTTKLSPGTPLFAKQTHARCRPHFCQTNRPPRSAVLFGGALRFLATPLSPRHGADYPQPPPRELGMTPGRPFLPNKLARGASRRYLVLGTSRPARAEALAPARPSTPRSPAARSRGIFPLPPHPKSDLAEASSSVPFRADSASAKGFHKRAVGFPQSNAKRG